MAISTFLIAVVGTIVTVKWTEPRLGRYTGDVPREDIAQPTALEKKGLRNTGFLFLGWLVLLLVTLLPKNGLFRGVSGGLLDSPALLGIVPMLLFVTATAGIVYGFTVGRFKKAADVINGMNDSFKALSAYLVLVFFAAQFVAWFRWSNLGLLLAINGAETLQNADIGLIPLVILFVIFTAFTNFLMGSASAKWAIMGPVFIPIFMLLGYSPELAQAVFRVGDSITNVISPMMSFFALIIVYYQKYDKKAGIGTIVATMLPFSIAFFLGWTLLLIVWIVFGLPLGPGVSLFYP
jgi:aminobenzoyl-glutamate transport protein